MNGKALFVRFGTFSHTNLSVLEQLRINFPDVEIEDFDLPSEIGKGVGDRLLALWRVLFEYGPKELSSLKKIRRARWTSAPMFRRIRDMVRERVSGSGDYRFTFQTQSLFDASVPGIPHFVYTDHTVAVNDHYPLRNRRHIYYSRRWLRLEPEIYRNATAVFTMSDHVSRSLRDDYGLPAGRAIRVGVGCNAFRDGVLPDLAAAPRDRYERKNILFVGTEWDLKGGPELAAAFALVLETHPDARLTVVGASPELDLPNCEVHGVVPLERVRDFFSEATVFCMPSRGDAFGIVFVEAFLSGLPVVALNIGAAPDIVRDGVTGHLLDPDDIEGLARKLSAILGDPEGCRRMGEAGRKLAEESYTWSRVGLRLKEEIIRLIG